VVTPVPLMSTRDVGGQGRHSNLRPTQRRQPLRFVRYYVVLARPFSEVERDLLAGVYAWLPSIAEQARDYAVRLLTEVGLEKDSLSAGSVVKLGRPRRTKQATRLPIEVRVAGRQGMHSLFVGQLEIAPIGPNATQIGIAAVYQPQWELQLAGVVRRTGGRALVHRVAEAAAREFMEQIGVRLGLGKPAAPSPHCAAADNRSQPVREKPDERP
jgi:hypothetical protein